MRKLKLKRWVQVLLIIVGFISIILLAGDCENDSVFYMSKIIGLILFYSASNLLYKYGG